MMVYLSMITALAGRKMLFTKLDEINFYKALILFKITLKADRYHHKDIASIYNHILLIVWCSRCYLQTSKINLLIGDNPW